MIKAPGCRDRSLAYGRVCAPPLFVGHMGTLQFRRFDGEFELLAYCQLLSLQDASAACVSALTLLAWSELGVQAPSGQQLC